MNRPEVNQKLSKKTVLKEYNEEIERLRRELVSVQEQQGVYVALDNYQQMMAEVRGSQNVKNIFLKRMMISFFTFLYAISAVM
jgi:kinesin family protein 11